MEKAKENLELITRYFSDFTPTQTEQFLALDGLYKDWNSKINVISRKDEESLYSKHILHSLSIAAAFDLPPGTNVLDIGTGGGFPGIPLAIFFPDVTFYLADSIGKKIKVVKAVADAIGLKNVVALHTRAEDIKNKKFEVVVSRAVAPLKDLWKWGKPLLRRAVGRGQRVKTGGQRYGLLAKRSSGSRNGTGPLARRVGVSPVRTLSHPVPPPCGKHTPVGHLHALRCLKNWVVSSVPRYRGGTVGQQGERDGHTQSGDVGWTRKPRLLLGIAPSRRRKASSPRNRKRVHLLIDD